MEVLHLVVTLMDHFLEGSAPLRLFKLTQKRRLVFVTLLICVNVLTEQFLQGNAPFRHLLNEETLFLSSQISTIKEVNESAKQKNYYMGAFYRKYF